MNATNAKRPIMIRAGHASRATRYRNEADSIMEHVKELRAKANSLTKQAKDLQMKATEQDELANTVKV